ncbi:MAG: histidine phosphatase family protein [Bacteriovoracia bacterium]
MFYRIIALCFFVWSQFLFAQKIIVVRHGEALQNVLNVINSDIEKSKQYSLTKTGRNQIRETGLTLRKLGFADEEVCKIFVSPLHRTKQTAGLLAETMELSLNKITTDFDIREIEAGNHEGLTVKKAEALNKLGVPYHGETNIDVEKRLAEFIKRLEHLPQEKTVFVVTHGLPAQLLIQMLKSEKLVQMPEKGSFTIVER